MSVPAKVRTEQCHPVSQHFEGSAIVKFRKKEIKRLFKCKCVIEPTESDASPKCYQPSFQQPLLIIVLLYFQSLKSPVLLECSRCDLPGVGADLREISGSCRAELT